MKIRMRKSGWMAFLWTAAAFFLSSIPSRSIPKTFLNEIFGIDKLAHLVIYGIMTVLWSGHLMRLWTLKSAVLWSVIFCTSFGLIMEIYQKVFFEDRMFDWLDSGANFVGAIIGAFFFLRYGKEFYIFANPTKS